VDNILFKRKQGQSDDIQDVGRGKFKIVNDNQEKAHVGKVVDASEIFNCDK
jgi:hypothetical protein